MAAALENIRTCNICYEIYDTNMHKPLMLPCGHPICNACVHKLEENNSKTCSICTKSWEGYDASNLIVCFPLISDESESPVSDIKCNNHKFELIFWCSDCFKMLCKQCATDDHKNCNLQIMENAVDDIKDRLVAKSSDLTSELLGMEEKLNNELISNNKSIAEVNSFIELIEKVKQKLKKRNEEICLLRTLIDAKMDYSHKVLNEIFDSGGSIPKYLMKLHETQRSMQMSSGILIPKDFMIEPLLEIVSKHKVRIPYALNMLILFSYMIKGMPSCMAEYGFKLYKFC